MTSEFFKYVFSHLCIKFSLKKYSTHNRLIYKINGHIFIPMKMYSQGWSQIAILSWGARATGINLDWCLTPGIKQKATSVRLCIRPWGTRAGKVRRATKKLNFN
jgi:hypothetical protein